MDTQAIPYVMCSHQHAELDVGGDFEGVRWRQRKAWWQGDEAVPEGRRAARPRLCAPASAINMELHPPHSRPMKLCALLNLSIQVTLASNNRA